MATIDPAIVLNRLVADERLLRRLLKHYLEFDKLTQQTAGSVDHEMQSKDPAIRQQQIHACYLQLICELEQFRLFAARQRLQHEANVEEGQRYGQDVINIAQNTHEVGEQVEKLKEQLEEARRERERKLEYDRLAAEINKLPTRAASHRSITQLQEEIRELGNNQTKHEDRVELRRTHMRQVLEAIAAMTAAIQAETDEDPRIDAAALEMADADAEAEAKPETLQSREQPQERENGGDEGRPSTTRALAPSALRENDISANVSEPTSAGDDDEEEGELPEEGATSVAMMEVDEKSSAA
ncbi:Tho complex subunit 7-domain-containing protein [Thamnocephalis sphaerospora]|uniref:Tho complex subunit 7-domain-containing protein n=1 Tax=Thamnocephalis sphaerospora TaxID=78915 RepID=A0A4P9XN80_9FUNG|nr:Tho complex subunit 7-domain-containing protein [Thamnocephalis sphaerospora]|eukprot:RKP07376.1 Tho complex subunit 7-domain-containing protein [Thamnocephalis sphaerospora]